MKAPRYTMQPLPGGKLLARIEAELDTGESIDCSVVIDRTPDTSLASFENNVLARCAAVIAMLAVANGQAGAS